MYNTIINPETGRNVSIYGKIGQRIINNYLKKCNQLGGAALGSAAGGGYEPEWIEDLTCNISKIIKNHEGITHNGSSSFYNPGITWIGNIGKKEYYHVVVRASVEKDKTNIDSAQKMKMYDTIIRSTGLINYSNPNYAIDRICDYPGDIYNKWLPFFWCRHGVQDKTYYLVMERDGHRNKFIECQNVENLWDSRILNTYEQHEGKAHVIVWGNFSSHVQKIVGLDPKGECVLGDGAEKIGAKHYFVDPNSTNGLNPVISSNDPNKNIKNAYIDQVAPCLSKLSATEKNYSILYLHYDDDARAKTYGSNSRGTLVHYHMTRGSGNEFFFLPGPPDNFMSNDWIKITPPNSDAFKNIEKLFDFLNRGKIQKLCRVSCTTPMIVRPSSDGSNEILAVAHLKLKVWQYIDLIINGSIPDGRDTNIFRFIEHSLFPHLRDSLVGETNDHWVLLNKRNKGSSFRKCCGPESKDCESIYHSILNMSDAGIHYLKTQGVVFEDKDNIGISRNLHPEYIYFMVFYKLDYSTLQLKSYSSPFMICRDKESAYLNFPVGLTTHQDKIWLSYGDGDIKTLLSQWSYEQISEICNHYNDSDPSYMYFMMINQGNDIIACKNDAGLYGKQI